MGCSSTVPYTWNLGIERKDVVVNSAETRQGTRFEKQCSPRELYFRQMIYKSDML